MQKLISKYGLAAHLALLAVAPLFLFPFFAPAEIATVELWLSLLSLVWTLMEPSRRNGEMLHDARTRVAGAIVRDPLFWALVVVVVYALVRWANSDVALKCDFNSGSPVWLLKSPSCAFLPSGVPGTGYPIFAAAVSALVIVQGCGHALGKSARVAFLFLLSVLSGLAGLVGVGLAAGGYGQTLSAAWCADMTASSFVGSLFGLNLLAGVAALVGVFEYRWVKRSVFLFVAVGGNLVGLFFFAPTPVVLIHLVAAVLLVLASMVYAGFALGIATMAKALSVLVLTLAVPILVIAGLSFHGEKCAARIAASCRTVRMSAAAAVEVSTDELASVALHLACSNRFAAVSGDALFPPRYHERRPVLSAIAARVWREHPWLGAGVGSYPLALRFAARAEDWAVLDPGADACDFVESLKRAVGDRPDRDHPDGLVPIPVAWQTIGTARAVAPFNGWWTLLAERGILAALILALLLGTMLFYFVRRLIGALGESVFVPASATGVLAAVALVAETFLDASALRPEILVAAAALLAVSVSSFPPAKRVGS